jgi:hypothetical protein
LRLFILEHFRERATGVRSARATDVQPEAQPGVTSP